MRTLSMGRLGWSLIVRRTRKGRDIGRSKRFSNVRPVFSIVKPQLADWLDNWVKPRPSAGLVGLIADLAAELLVNLARIAEIIYT